MFRCTRRRFVGHTLRRKFTQRQVARAFWSARGAHLRSSFRDRKTAPAADATTLCGPRFGTAWRPQNLGQKNCSFLAPLRTPTRPICLPGSVRRQQTRARLKAAAADIPALGPAAQPLTVPSRTGGRLRSAKRRHGDRNGSQSPQPSRFHFDRVAAGSACLSHILFAHPIPQAPFSQKCQRPPSGDGRVSRAAHELRDLVSGFTAPLLQQFCWQCPHASLLLVSSRPKKELLRGLAVGQVKHRFRCGESD